MDTKFIETGYKLRFMLTFCVITVISVSLASLFFYILTYRELSHDYGQAFFALQSVKKAIFPLLFASIQSIALLTLVSIVMAVLLLIYSHKIAGPIYRFEKSMGAVGSGDLTCIVKLRTGDQIMNIEKTMCTSINSMNHRVRSIKDTVHRIRTLEERLKSLLETDQHKEGIKEVVEDLRTELDRLNGIMDTINTDNKAG